MPAKGQKKSLAERFEAKVMREPMSGCWLWTGKRDAYGYGLLVKAGPFNKELKAHRLSHELHMGPIPEGLEVAHHCDNPPCVNPSHLYAATHSQNISDRTLRKREPRGEQCSWAKVDLAGVARIRKHVGPLDDVAADLGISRAQAYRIRSGECWV